MGGGIGLEDGRECAFAGSSQIEVCVGVEYGGRRVRSCWQERGALRGDERAGWHGRLAGYGVDE
jgi:hypothetical protein